MPKSLPREELMAALARMQQSNLTIEDCDEIDHLFDLLEEEGTRD